MNAALAVIAGHACVTTFTKRWHSPRKWQKYMVQKSKVYIAAALTVVTVGHDQPVSCAPVTGMSACSTVDTATITAGNRTISTTMPREYQRTRNHDVIQGMQTQLI
jgi:hypothetical protein